MGSERHKGPIEALRHLALSLDHLAASEAASGAVRGAADGLRKEISELDGQVRTLIQDVLTVLGRLAHEAAEHERGEPGAAAHTLASAAMQGALEVLEREWRDGGLPFHGFMQRIDHLFGEVMEFARSRTHEIRAPGERARSMVRGMMEETTARLHEVLPAFAEEARVLAPLGREVASHVGQGLVEGIETKLREDSDALVCLIERAGRSFVRGLTAGVHDELTSIKGGVAEALGARLRRPVLAVAGAGGVLAILAWRAMRRRGTRARKG